jgi:hypothetical protein
MAEDVEKITLEQKGYLTKEKKPEDQIKIFEKAKMMVKERWKDQLLKNKLGGKESPHNSHKWEDLKAKKKNLN